MWRWLILLVGAWAGCTVDPTSQGAGVPEVCGNGQDDDQDGAVDCSDTDCAASCVEACFDGLDNDGDLNVDCADPDCDGSCPEQCEDGRDNDGDGSVDCNDLDCATTCPEVCDDGKDNNANGLVDCLDPTCSLPSCAEVCTDGWDNDADGLVDCDDDQCAHPTCAEVCTDGRDNDGDSFADCDDADCDGDCPEICDDGRDNDADLLVDCADDECTELCDADGDGYINQAFGGDDCDDDRPDVNPAGTERCNGVARLDDDCDGLVDEADPDLSLIDLNQYGPDEDGDGYGITDDIELACAPPPGYGTISPAADCDDDNPEVNPGAAEICNDIAPLDDDCDRLVDDDDPDITPDSYLTWYRDQDADGYGDERSGTLGACARPVGYAAYDEDCDDRDPEVGPPSLWYPDNDRDGHGAGAAHSPTPTCDAPAGNYGPDWRGLDCDDRSPTVYPGARETCEDGIDQDCDGEDMLCIAPNPECSTYRTADQSWRNVDSVGPVYCDSSVLSLPNWYRFVEPAGTRMPERPPGEYHCGTHAPGWLEGTHPTILGETRDIRVCFQWSGSTCLWSSTVRVTYCGGYDDFYVYYLPTLPFGCNGTYCAE
jgi:hypothetical protein